MKFEKQFPNTIFGAVILIICSILIAAPFLCLTDYFLIYFNQEYIDRFIALLIFLFILVFAFIINRKKGNSINYSFKLPNNLSLIVLSVLIVITIQIGINSILATGINTLMNNHYPLKDPFHDNYFSLFSIIFISPFFEELIFRGTFLRGFLSNYNVPKSIAYSAALFGLIHFAPSTVVCALLLGLFFGWIYFKTGSVALTILLHITANLTTLFTMYFRFQIADHSSWFNIYGKYSLIIILSSILLLISCFKQLIKQSKKGNFSTN